MHYFMSRSAEFTAGWVVAKGHLDPIEHLDPSEVGKVNAADRVTLLDWVPEDMSRAERVRIEKALNRSGAALFNGAGHVYSWGYPPPWEHDGTEPGSAITEEHP